jgi:hypothetical protein
LIRFREGRTTNLIDNKQVINLARRAWDFALKEYYYPPLKEPNFTFDFSRKEGFYIDPQQRWRITMNLANVPPLCNEENYVNYLKAICLHEVGHYQIIPYDGITHAKLLKAALTELRSYQAAIAVNLFSDLIIDKMLYNKYPDLFIFELQCTFDFLMFDSSNHLSKFSTLLFRCYEVLLDRKITNFSCKDDIHELAERIVNVIAKKLEDPTTWEKKVKKICFIIKDLLDDTFKVMGKNDTVIQGNTKKKSPGDSNDSIQFPDDIVSIMDDPLAIRNKDVLNSNQEELRERSEEFAFITPFSQFGAPASMAGLLQDLNPLAIWYRALAKNLLTIHASEPRVTNSLSIYPEVWHVGDSISELDIQQSFLNSSVLVPNITTKKWKKTFMFGTNADKDFPNLLIVIDSSGSMNWNYRSKTPSGKYHYALLSSFAVLHYAVKKGVEFSVINFSNRGNICPWTKNYIEAESILLKYQGGGTELPTKEILQDCESCSGKALIFLITDFGLHNWVKAKDAFFTLASRGHKIIGFFIGSSKLPESKLNELEHIIRFYPVKSQKDIPNLIITECKASYS